MGKKKVAINEDILVLPPHPSHSIVPIVDTHTHLVSTFAAYKQKWPSGSHATIFDFVRGVYGGSTTKVRSIVDVWCEAPVRRVWREIADSALTEENRHSLWGSIDYWFVMGVHPHEAKLYNDDVEKDILEAMAHPRCVGWGEIGLDYHYDNSSRKTQQTILIRQLRQAVRLGKPVTIHTREAEEDTERILKTELPKDHKIHVHCYTDSPALAQRLLEHFTNLHIGITGVITYATNVNTTSLVKQLCAQSQFPRIILETDAPYMVPSNLYASLPGFKGRLPLCHTGMIPWTADAIAEVAGEGWNVDRVMKLGFDNARKVYDV